MPTIKSQNVIRPDIAKPEGSTANDSPLSSPRESIDYHHDNHGLSNTSGNKIFQSRTVMDFPVVQRAYSIDSAQIAAARSSKGAKGKHTRTNAIYEAPRHSLSVQTLSPSASMISPIRHIRRWTTNLTSSKSSRKASNKVRAIGPIGSPQPLKTAVPFPCTPLPYSPTSPTSPSKVSPEPRSPTRLATSCPELPIGPQSSDISDPPATYSSLSCRYRTKWKGRLFQSTGKKHSRHASTQSSLEDDAVEADTNAKSTKRTTKRSMRISAPLTQPTLPTNQKTIPIPTPLLSPTDGMDETDTFDPLKAIPFTKGKPRKRQSTSDSIRSILDALIMIATNTPIDDTLEQEVNLEESYPLSKDEVSVGCVRKSMEIQALVPGTSICQEPESYLDEMPSPSPKETRRSSADGDAYPQSKATRTQVTPGPEVKRKISVPRSSSASSDSSTSSDSLVSSSSTPSKSSPVSADATVASAPGKSFGASRSLLKSGGIKIPSSLLTLLPSSAAKGKPSQIVRSITPPSTPPLDQTEGMLNDTAAEDPQDQQQQEQSSIKRMTQATDPRALTLKRMAYLHTLKKLRERERRPFRHAVLLHLMILQLRRGITDYHCGEIADFYTAMWAAQFPARWDIASAIALAQQRPNNLQQTPHQTLQDYQQQPGAPQSSMARPKRPLSTPVQSRLQTSITQSPSGGNSSNSADDSDASMTSGILSPSPQRTMQAAPFRDESSTTSIPPELIAELERKSSFASFTTRRSPPPASSESDSDHDQDDESEEDSDKEDYPAHDEKGKEKEIVCSSPQPTAIVPKRTTGRKGLIYHQQQQLQVQVQQHLQGGNAPSDHQVTEGRTHKALEHASTWMQAQLLGTRPRFATSTLTTVATNGSELSTRPLVAVPVMMAPQALTKSQSNVPHWGFQPQMSVSIPSVYIPHRHPSLQIRSPTSPLTSPTFSTAMSPTSPTSPGLLTPPLSPLFHTVSNMSFPVPPSTAVSFQGPNTVSTHVSPVAGYRTPQVQPHVQSRASSLNHSQVPVSSYTLNYVQRTHTVPGHSDKTNRVSKMDLRRSQSSGRASLETIRQPAPHQFQPMPFSGVRRSNTTSNASITFALPTPPHSPTMNVDATTSTGIPVSGRVRGRKPRQREVSSESTRSERNSWASSHHQPAPELRTRRSTDDSRGKSRSEQKTFRRGPSPDSESEEDVPLALVRRRISTDVVMRRERM